jgi:hypothetical protein
MSFTLYPLASTFVGMLKKVISGLIPGQLIGVFLIACAFHSFGQRTYKFNSEGSSCYFEYVCYAPNDNYISARRPMLFILGKNGQTSLEAFNIDTLKNNDLFHNYLFVYLPNSGLSSDKKLHCLGPLASLLSYGFYYGHSNIFCQIYDSSIQESDLAIYDTKSDFKTVRLTEPGKTPSNSLADDFKEDRVAFEKYGVEKKPTEEFGTFYEEAPKDAEGEKVEQPAEVKRTYFGPPNKKNFTLTGIIKDKSTGEVLPFATVMIKSNSKGTTTNADGQFTLLKVPNDTCTLIIQYIGYSKTEIYLTPMIPTSNFLIELNPNNVLKTVTVVGVKEDVVLVNKADVSVIKMTPKKLEQLPNIGERDIMRSFQLMPGVSAANESSSGLYVRGGTPDQNLVLYDGFTVYQVDHLYGFFSAFNSNALKDVQLYKGGFESKFGGRLSSVTEITGKDGNQNKINFGGDVSLLSVNAFLEVPVGKKFSSIITFRRSYQGFLYNEISGKLGKGSKGTTNQQGSSSGRRNTQNATVSSFFYDLNGKFTFRPTDKDVISLSVFNGTDKLDNSIASGGNRFGGANSGFSFSTTDLTKYGNVGSSLKYSRKWSSKLYGNTIVSFSNYYSNRDRSQERTVTTSAGETTTKSGIFENNDLKDYSIKSDYQWDIFSFSQLQFGGFATYYDIKYKYAQNDTLTILDRHDLSMLRGGYIQAKNTFFDGKMQFLPGIRVSYFENTKQMYYEPRVSLSYNLTRQITLKGAAGRYYQFANRVTREDILTGSKDFWILADGKKVPVSSSIHYIAGISYENNNFLFSTEAYYKQISDLTEYSLRFNASPLGTNYNENFFNGNGFAKGIEFLLQKKSGKFNGWVSYTLAQARNKFLVYSDDYYPANQDVTHEFKIVLMYKYKRFDFSATWIYATGRPYTAPSGAYNVTLLDGSTQDFFTVTTKNGLRLPDYHRADIAINYKLLAGANGDKRRREIGYIGFSIFNLYNRKNVWYKTYTIDNGAITETNVNYLGIVPNITLSLKLR